MVENGFLQIESMRSRFREGMPPTIFSQLGPATPR